MEAPTARRAGDSPTCARPTGSLRKLFARLHRDQRGGVSIETVLILAAIALPVLIFVLKFGWPRIKAFFIRGLEDLEGGAQDANSVTALCIPRRPWT